MGAVYEVLHRDTQRKRAMKVMLPHVLANDDMRQRFKREGLVTAGIDSEHLVEVFDVGIDEQTQAPFLVMELLRGEDLGARLARGERTKPAEMLEIIEQVVRALERTHAAGIVHRDLKPENLFVTRRDDGSLRMKLLDFGIAKLIDRSSKDTASVGTPLFMAPEQMTGQSSRIGPACDVYALAQIVFTLLVGRAYFQPDEEAAHNLMGLLFKVAQGTTEKATMRGAAGGVALPEAFDGWFAKATALDPEERYRSVTELFAQLRESLKGVGDELPSSSAKRRVVAFQATQPLASLAEPNLPNHAEAKSVGLTPVRAASPTRQSVGQGTGPVPSTHTIAQAEGTGAPRSKLIGVVAVIAALGIAAGVTVMLSQSKSSSSSAAAPESASVPASEAQGQAPIQVTPKGAERSAATTSAPTAAPSVSVPSATASVSAVPATTSTPSQPTAGATSKPLVTARPTAAPTSVPTGVSTVWSGPRR
jgi:serine/threonine-protein kinase